MLGQHLPDQRKMLVDQPDQDLPGPLRLILADQVFASRPQVFDESILRKLIHIAFELGKLLADRPKHITACQDVRHTAIVHRIGHLSSHQPACTQSIAPAPKPASIQAFMQLCPPIEQPVKA